MQNPPAGASASPDSTSLASTPPAVSVLMPVYNAEQYLEAAVRSILDQTYRDFELIIIDDGSTDGSLAILQRLAAEDTRIRLVSRPNTGYTIALNQAIALARGQLLARMDADDISMPNRFHLQVDYLNAHPECVALGGRLIMIDPTGLKIMDFCKLTNHVQIDGAHINGGPSELGHPSVMMRRDAVVAAGGYDPAFEPAEDFDLWLRLAEHGRLAGRLSYPSLPKSKNKKKAVLVRT
jgi:glycosyltransferase involved in cell wall biosynthesis